MNILKKITLKNLKLNRKRTIVTIIGVMLSTALICAVAGMVTSTRKTMINAYKAYDGNYYACFENIPNDQLKYIEENENVKEYSITREVGYAQLENSKNEDKPYINVMEFDKKALENNGLKLTSGRLPENNKEIVISESILNNARVYMNVGDKITLNIGDRISNLTEQKLTQNDPYTSIKDSEIPNEKIINQQAKEYTIVGIIARVSYNLEDYSAPGYTCISYLEDGTTLENANVSVLYKNAKGYADKTQSILKILKDHTKTDYKVIYNSNLADIEGGISDETTKALITVAGVIIGIILISSIFVIRNSFVISVSEKTKQYGILSSIGATSKQIKKSVLFEGFIIGAIGITLGILLGIIAVLVLIWIMNYILKDSLNDLQFVYSVPLIAVGISILISIITIYLSCIIPARKAAKISPIEAIRGNNDVKIKAKKLKVSKLTKKIFGIGGVIAKKNLKRSKKKYRTTVISLVVSIAIFVSLASFIDYGKKSMGMYYKDLGYNIEVIGEKEEQYKNIIKLNNISNYVYAKQLNGQVDINKYGTDYGKDIEEEHAKLSNQVDSTNEYKTYLYITILNKQYFEKFAKEIGINTNDYKNISILEDDIYNNKRKEINNLYSIKDGEDITLKVNDKSEKTITVTKRSDKRPMGFESIYTNGGTLFISEENSILNNEEPSLGALFIKAQNADELENTLNDLKKSNQEYSAISVLNINSFVKQEKSFILLISIFLYGFIAVITLIGVTNIFNTITTNMILRSKEFATLKSIGMTSKEFNKMIRLESILYGLKSLIIGIPIGLLGSYGIYKGIMKSVDFGYIIPWKAIVISIIFVFIIVGLTMKYSLNKINKQNIIETIREENI